MRLASVMNVDGLGFGNPLGRVVYLNIFSHPSAATSLALFGTGRDYTAQETTFRFSYGVSINPVLRKGFKMLLNRASKQSSSIAN